MAGTSVAARFRALRPAASLESYIANPIGSYVAGRNAAAFWATDALIGVIVWGHPDEEDVDLILGAVRAEARPAASCRTSLVDLRNLEVLDLRVLDRLYSDLTAHIDMVRPHVTQRALMVPAGPIGALVTELFGSQPPKIPVRLFADGAEALAWTNINEPALLDELKRFPRVCSIHEPFLFKLRALLDAHPVSRAGEMARRHGMTPRTFQRRLGAVGTSFQRELNAARLRIAKRLMQTTDDALKAIAIESGYASLQHFSSSFRHHIGVSPARWRSGGAGR